MTALIVVMTLVFVGVIVPLFPPNRRREIQEIVSDLEVLKLDPKYTKAAETNIRFFKAARSIFTFIHWLIFVAPKLRKDRASLLELGDLPLEKWQMRGYEGLTKIEKHKFGGIMFTGFIKELYQIILKMKESRNNNEAAVMLDLGFGGGELGRRLFRKLNDVPLVYIGIDITPANIEVAKQCFKPLHEKGEIVFKELTIVSDEVIDALRRGANDASKKVVAVWLGNVFDLDKHVSAGKIDIICHSRVLHHIEPVDRPRLVDICQKLSPITVEMEDCYRLSFLFWATVVMWLIYPNVALMNGGILSCLRDPAKEELTGYFKLVPPFSYVRLILGQNVYCHNEQWETARKTLITGFSFVD